MHTLALCLLYSGVQGEGPQLTCTDRRDTSAHIPAPGFSPSIPLSLLQAFNLCNAKNCIAFLLKGQVADNNSMDKALLEKLTANRLVKKLVVLYGTGFYIMP
jgi:hypothetical protein